MLANVLTVFEYNKVLAIYGPFVLLIIPVEPVGDVPIGAVVVALYLIVVVDPSLLEFIY